MANIKPIRSERDYEAALARISELMDSQPDSPEGEEFDVLVDLVELYESNLVPMGGTCGRVFRRTPPDCGWLPSNQRLGEACGGATDGQTDLHGV